MPEPCLADPVYPVTAAVKRLRMTGVCTPFYLRLWSYACICVDKAGLGTPVQLVNCGLLLVSFKQWCKCIIPWALWTIKQGFALLHVVSSGCLPLHGTATNTRASKAGKHACCCSWCIRTASCLQHGMSNLPVAPDLQQNDRNRAYGLKKQAAFVCACHLIRAVRARRPLGHVWL